MVEALTEIGYELRSPEATFYLMVRAPIEDDWAFTRSLAEHDVFVLPGELVEMPGYFRISFTASDAMIDRAIPGFQATLEEAQSSR
jgi:aspartate aminotransferase